MADHDDERPDSGTSPEDGYEIVAPPEPIDDLNAMAAEQNTEDGKPSPDDVLAIDTLPFYSVLFSFRGRINRRTLWIRGLVALFLIETALGFVAFTLFVVLATPPADGSDPGLLAMAARTVASQSDTGKGEFVAVGEQVQGGMTTFTGAALVKVDLALNAESERAVKSVVVGGHEMKMALERRPQAKSSKSASYSAKSDWGDYPNDIVFSIRMVIVSAALIVITLLSMILTLWGQLAIAIKRFHDRDRRGWWVLVSLIPVLGQLWMFYELGLAKGTDGENRFGADPLTAVAV